MRSRLLLFTLALVLCGAVSAGAAWIDPALLERMDDAEANELIAAYVVMREQADLDRVVADAARFGGGLDARHAAVITRLREVARDTQGPLLTELSAGAAAGTVSKVKPFWISNSIAISATPQAIRGLARRGDVGSIYLDYPIELIAPVSGPVPSAAGAFDGVENGISEIRAPELWAMGIDGTGTLACDQDTGADGSHPAFADRWRGLDSGVSPSEAWFDPVYGQTFPTDSSDHGTHTLGTMVGDDGSGNQIGMAPGAKWIGAKTIDISGGDIFTDAVAAFQWMADPDEDPMTTDDVPDVANNSWGLSQSWYGSCRSDFNAAIDAAEAAGVVVVFAAGNEGSGSQTLRSPGNRIASDLNAFAVGALEQDGETIVYFSSRGPSDCDGATIKPEVCAVGVDVRSALPGGSYGTMSGTSMACPHVAGAVLLLRQAFPDATPDDIKYGLYMSAVDLGSAGEDNTYGRGRIDVVAAYLFLMDYLMNSDGKVDILGDAYACGDSVGIEVSDGDLTGPSVSVTVRSDTETSPETVILTETGTQGKYTGSVATAAGLPVPDGVLQLSDGDTITVTYIDEDDGSGGHNVEKTDTAIADCAAPTFGGLTGAVAGDGQVTLTWNPAGDANPVSYNVYRALTSGGQDFDNSTATASASPYVDVVANGDTYYYVVRAQDSLGNEDSNLVELDASPTGPELIWRETWGESDAWDHEWSIIDGGTGSGTWTDANPGGRSPDYMTGNFMIVDSDYYGTSDMDEQLVSESIDASGFENVFVKIAHHFYHYESETADVDVAIDGGAWTKLAQYRGSDASGIVSLDLPGGAAESLQIRFHYYDAYYEWWWAVDTVEVWGWGGQGPTVVCWLDSDQDGFGDPDVSDQFEGSVCPDGWVDNALDCDDSDGAINPDADDIACDGVDDDCDGTPDQDYAPYTCGLGECEEMSTCTAGFEDCTPGEPEDEICDDELDNDCDGLTDRDDPDCPALCPTASFTYLENELVVSFTDTSTPGDAPIVTWLWEFGDEQTSGEQNPTHGFPSEGTFVVCLTVTDSNACPDQHCEPVEVEEDAGICGMAPTGNRGDAMLLPVLILLAGMALLIRRRA